MSSDNYWMIRKRSDGKFCPVMGFASDDFDADGNGVTDEETYARLTIKPTDPAFDSLAAALDWAMDSYTEYGVSVHPECEDDS